MLRSVNKISSMEFDIVPSFQIVDACFTTTVKLRVSRKGSYPIASEVAAVIEAYRSRGLNIAENVALYYAYQNQSWQAEELTLVDWLTSDALEVDAMIPDIDFTNQYLPLILHRLLYLYPKKNPFL